MTTLPPYTPSPLADLTTTVTNKLPVVCLVLFIVDLVLCVLRFPVAGFSAIGLAVLEYDDPLRPSAYLEIATGLGIAVSGTAAAIGLLCKKRWGVTLGFLAAVLTVASIFVAIYQLSLSYVPAQNSAPEETGRVVGFFVGASCSVVFRVLLLGAYVFALVKFMQWIEQRDKQIPSDF